MSEKSNLYSDIADHDEERERLILQSRFLGDLSRTFFARAGLAPGMDVLDIGCGTGDLSFLASAFVGSEGSVVGVDQSEDSISLATERAEGAGVNNVRFEVREVENPGDLGRDQPFDALVGRLIMLYLSEPASVLADLASRVRPGGLIVLQEFDMSVAGSHPEAPLYNQCGEWILEAFTRAGIDIHLGLRLRELFAGAGLAQPETFGTSRVESGPDSEIYEWTAATLRTLLPVLEQTGVVEESEIGFDTLAGRMRDDAVKAHATLRSPMLVGAWART